MPDLADGESTTMQGSGREPYVIKNVGGVYSCTCPAWRNQSIAIDTRTCKHIRKLRGDQAEQDRIGQGAKAVLPAVKSPDPNKAVPGLLLAHSWDNEQDLTGWWMSEKLDGVRAYWDGKQFISRLGNLFHPPAWFVSSLPDMPLDGEIWAGRKLFQKTSGIVRSVNAGDAWKQLRFVVFDAPALSEPFEKRTVQIKKLLKKAGQYASAIEHTPCLGVDHLRDELVRLNQGGAEGIMLRQPESLYEAGRSTTLLKVKSFQDVDVVVLKHLPGAGRHKGRLGALLVTLDNGTQFSVGTGFSDAQRNSPPAVGSTVTVRYQELTDGGVPRFPSFVRVRRDA